MYSGVEKPLEDSVHLMTITSDDHGTQRNLQTRAPAGQQELLVMEILDADGLDGEGAVECGQWSGGEAIKA
jgi:hypothetical protein